MNVLVRYVALLRDEGGLSEESVETERRDLRGLYQELRARHAFSLAESRLQVAVNDDFASWEQALHDGDQVVFLPPVAGG